MQRLSLTVAFAFALLSGAAHAGPISDFYLTSGDNQTMLEVQGNSVVNSWSIGSGEYPLAVMNTIRTENYYNGYSGREYTLGGTPTGNVYPAPLLPQGDALTDGTTNGVNNFGVQYTTGSVYSYGLDWSGGHFLFFTGRDTLGITYDPIANGLWLAGLLADGNYGLALYSLAGVLETSFDTLGGRNAALGLDPADHTLWFYSQTSAELYQYSTSGTNLAAVSVSGLTGRGYNVLGGEFAFTPATPVPEPSPLILMMAGMGMLWVIRRRHRGKGLIAR